MNKRGFASMYMVYSFFLIFITMLLSVLLIQGYKKNFLTRLKMDAMEEMQMYHLEVLEEVEKNPDKNN